MLRYSSPSYLSIGGTELLSVSGHSGGHASIVKPTYKFRSVSFFKGVTISKDKAMLIEVRNNTERTYHWLSIKRRVTWLK